MFESSAQTFTFSARIVRPCWLATAWLLVTTVAHGDPIEFQLRKVPPDGPFQVKTVDDVLSVRWRGRAGHRLEMELCIERQRPVIRRLAVAADDGPAKLVGKDVMPEFSIVSGIRRITQQQTEPLEDMGVPITAEIIDRHKWDAFWDAPLVTGDRAIKSRTSSIPSSQAFANHPGLPRLPSEVVRGPTRWDCHEIIVSGEGKRLIIRFPGVEAGLFEGSLQLDLFSGSNLIRQMAIVKTEHTSVAFKYNAGLSGLLVAPEARLVYRDLSQDWQHRQLAEIAEGETSIITSANRLLAADMGSAGLAVFPPPHSFYWARETERNLGYRYVRKRDRTFAIGVRQAEREQDDAFEQNFALYNARPGTWQRLPVFYELSPAGGKDALVQALRYTGGDRFRELPGYRVMGHHYHAGMMERLGMQPASGQSDIKDRRINDAVTAKATGIDIYSIVDGVRGPARHDRGEAFVDALHQYYQAASRHSDDAFLLLPSDENSTGGRPPFLGGHYDLLPSHPVYWRPRRDRGEPLYSIHPKYGRVYHIQTADDLMKMCEAENVLVSMPHPNTKRSTGYPDAILNEPHFVNERYFSLGYRWGMGIDASERRLGEYRFLRLWDRVNNHLARIGRKPKFALAISEVRSDHGTRGKPLGDDVYGMSPVNYVRLDRVPTVADMSPLIASLAAGDYFVTSGEVLIPQWSVDRSGDQLRVSADVHWTFPLDFVEVVWGDGERVDRKIVSAKQFAAFDRHRFEVRIPTAGVRWVRLAAWDCAGNGALTQPVSHALFDPS